MWTCSSWSDANCGALQSHVPSRSSILPGKSRTGNHLLACLSRREVHDLVTLLAVASRLDLLRTQVPRFLMRTKSRGSPNLLTLRIPLSRYSVNPQTPQGFKSRKHRNQCCKNITSSLEMRNCQNRLDTNDWPRAISVEMELCTEIWQ